MILAWQCAEGLPVPRIKWLKQVTANISNRLEYAWDVSQRMIRAARCSHPPLCHFTFGRDGSHKESRKRQVRMSTFFRMSPGGCCYLPGCLVFLVILESVPCFRRGVVFGSSTVDQYCSKGSILEISVLPTCHRCCSAAK